MTVTLYNNTSDNNVLSKNLTQITSVSGSLRNESSLLYPDIRIEAGAGSFANVNYMYISDFGRYYYITDIISERNNIVRVKGKVDPLMTYASQIRGCTGIVRRQQNNYNLYIDDGSLMTYANDKVFTKGFSGGFSSESYVLLVSGS